MVDWKQPELFIELADRVDLPDWTFHLIGFADDDDYFEEVNYPCLLADFGDSLRKGAYRL
ncbi:hypothetical protein BRC83_10265 [Halobacteriales archaeon QS_1_68_17]|nr:MAG: hypothetical protein BRC83_10265 [Halobacteriales archaeon QS_1_68_17]